MTESASSPTGICQGVSKHEFRLDDALKDQLGDAISSVNHEIFFAEIGQDDPHFAPVVGVNGSGAVEDSDAIFQCQTASRTDLTFVSDGYFQLHARGDGDGFARLDSDIMVQRRSEVES